MHRGAARHLFVAIYLVEYADRTSGSRKVTTFMVDILSGVPSIVAALFIYALWIDDVRLPASPASRCRWRWCC